MVHNKTPRPTRRIRTARSHFKTCWEKQDKTYSCITRLQDLQDAFEWHAPISRRVQKTKQDVFVRNKTPRPTRRIRTARSHFKTRSENKTRRICAKQDAKTYKTQSKGTLPFQEAFRETRQDVFVHNKTPRPTRRIRTARSHFKTYWENRTRRIRAKQDAKTYKTHSNGTLPFQDAFRQLTKTYWCITKHQDLQDAFERHAPISRRVQKNNTRCIRA